MTLSEAAIKNGATLNEKLLELISNAPAGYVLSEDDVFRTLGEMGINIPADQENALLGADLDYCNYIEQQKPLGAGGEYTDAQSEEHLLRLDAIGLVGDAREVFNYERRGPGVD